MEGTHLKTGITVMSGLKTLKLLCSIWNLDLIPTIMIELFKLRNKDSVSVMIY